MEKIIKNKEKEIRIEKKKYKGKEYLDIREYSIIRGKEEMIPTRRGITISLNKVLKLLDLIEKELKNKERPNKKKQSPLPPKVTDENGNTIEYVDNIEYVWKVDFEREAKRKLNRNRR